jgi:hypothetical protein
MTDKVQVSYAEGLAKVNVGGRALNVDRRRTQSRKNVCPTELLSVALGS